MNTPDTVGAISSFATPFIHHELAAFRAAERQLTASTVRLNYGGSVVVWTSEDDYVDDVNYDMLPTFEACSRAIIAAAERMVALARERRTMTVAIAYDECLDIITAAVDHIETIGSQGELQDNVIEACRAMRNIRELLRPSPPVRRALHF